MQLSKRLYAVAHLHEEGRSLADIGTDHAYIPIYLVQNHDIDRAIAMDIGRGPLQRAKDNICRYCLEEQITTRLSDGLDNLQDREADCMVIAGMGGALTIHILEKGQSKAAQMRECILQPQSEIEKVRMYLWEHHYAIVREDMVFEDGKYYPVMRVIPGRDQTIARDEYDVMAAYGPCLLQEKHPVLIQFLKKEQKIYEDLIRHLEKQAQPPQERLKQLYRQRKIQEQAIELLNGI